ncbi:hypothetical protein TNCV_2200371 [Trichonephila clavipes]|nr:hypothetical protein TNCV_2200371 [Trichonephila clavipes]
MEDRTIPGNRVKWTPPEYWAFQSELKNYACCSRLVRTEDSLTTCYLPMEYMKRKTQTSWHSVEADAFPSSSFRSLLRHFGFSLPPRGKKSETVLFVKRMEFFMKQEKMISLWRILAIPLLVAVAVESRYLIKQEVYYLYTINSLHFRFGTRILLKEFEGH